MSLDVYLTLKEKRKSNTSGVFIRENGQTLEISEKEWREKNLGQSPVRITEVEETNEIFWANITHNLAAMADEARIYEHLWRPDEIGVMKAKQLIKPLRAGIALLKSDPKRFKKLNPKNGWGSYEVFVPWIENYLRACEENPDAQVGVSR